MASNHEIGKKGEQLAEDWLRKQGYEIMNRNWRSGRYEIDIIASRNNVLHFIEVKTSRQERFGFPEQRVSPQKMKHVMTGSEQYLQRHPEWKAVQYDIIAIQWMKAANPAIFLLEDVYYYE